MKAIPEVKAVKKEKSVKKKKVNKDVVEFVVQKPAKEEALLIRQCHHCLKLAESDHELDRCPHCAKGLLPSQYFEKVQSPYRNLECQESNTTEQYKDLFSKASDLDPRDLLKGIFVRW